ncbi:MAG: branched-chain amino acid aminotransferase [Alphaproteobacteria bacterium]
MGTHNQKPIDQMDGYIWVDGKFVPWKEANIHFLTHGLHYGSCVFEGIRAYNGKGFKLTEHNKRLLKSAKIMDIRADYSVEELDKIVVDVLSKNNLKDAYIRPAFWLGSETMGIFSRNSKVHLAVAAWEWPSYFGDEALNKGISLCWSDWLRPHPKTEPTEAKASGLYMTSIISKNKAVDKGFDDALMKDYRGYIAESTGSNVFFIIDGEVYTPEADCFLNGITRQTVLEVAEKNGYKVHVAHLDPEDTLARAQEVFVTGTAAEITPVGKIEDKVYTVGSVTRDLREKYLKLVKGE